MSEYEKLMRECYEQSYGRKWRESSERQDVWATAWDASRVTLVVELPEHYQYDSPGDVIPVLRDVKEALTKAGVTVK